MGKYIHHFKTHQEYLDAVNGVVRTISGFTSGDGDFYEYCGTNQQTGRYVWSSTTAYEFPLIELTEQPSGEGKYYSMYYPNNNGGFGGPGSIYLEQDTINRRTRPIYRVPWVSYTDSVGVNFDIKYDYVDLGLSVLWATCNVGAMSPEQFGGYFAWGENTEKEKYAWDDCYVFSGGGADYPSKYGSDGKTVLEPEDDTAYNNMGNGWRMPTAAECGELVDGTNMEDYTLSGVAGCKIISKTDPSKYIFIPYAGFYMDDWNWDDPQLCADGLAFGIWSSSRSSYPWVATSLIGDNVKNDTGRLFGLSVRGVRDKN